MIDKRAIVLLDYRGQTYNDPPFRNLLEYYAKERIEIWVVMSKIKNGKYIEEIPGCKTIFFDRLISFIPNNSIVYKVLKRVLFFFCLNFSSLRKKKSVFITVMLEPVATLNRINNQSYLISSILDIPVRNGGKLDKYFNKIGWKKLRASNSVWSSDKYKAALTQQLSELNTTPCVCHNCPTTDYINLSNKQSEMDWLRSELMKAGATITDAGNILLRAGAIGIYGGIEETLEAMKYLPDDYIFLMIGRPELFFKDTITELIKKNKLDARVFLWERPSDEVWKKCLLGADIGHIIHVRPNNDPITAEAYDLNSSLSNNRLFQYMAAGLPIISYNDYRLQDIHKEINCFEVVDTNNLVENIVAVWKKLGKNRNIRTVMGQNGREAHLKKYNWEIQFADVRNIIDANLQYP